MVLSRGRYTKSPSCGLVDTSTSDPKNGVIKSSYFSFDTTKLTASVVVTPNFDRTSPFPSNPW